MNLIKIYAKENNKNLNFLIKNNKNFQNVKNEKNEKIFEIDIRNKSNLLESKLFN